MTTSSTVNVGIAIHRLGDKVSRTASYQWNLVLSTGSFDARDVRVYTISNTKDKGRTTCPWYLDHRKATLLQSSALQGVFQVPLIVPLTLAALDEFIGQFSSTRDGYNTRGRGWDSTAYTVRTLDSLYEAGCIKLPCRMDELVLYVEHRAARLESMREQPGYGSMKLAVLPL
ncbi:uncharacterized protein BT62DRAFT_935190 [Guyanagaster necrorhizus]|uniref:Uncharacterized protein n=1 Tax=Guyanagaster necrorhizus TaxID=856835 RepID=A0A9P7VMV6_9AGAR|nr:uncharacterized protein BT62DRAFT_935190 [Guyanagaster necrorhizus MCA 3950]KAG7443235.1 hypothetical protein BT62DRAFT_935190 [Guyanagaster necrorhizus MCA 3950]